MNRRHSLGRRGVARRKKATETRRRPSQKLPAARLAAKNGRRRLKAGGGALSAAGTTTALRTAEEALRESEDRYRRLVELSPDAILVSRNNRVVLANSAALRLFGATSVEQVLGKSAFDIMHPDYHEMIRQRTRTLSEGQSVPRIEEKIVRLDGTVRDVDVAASPFFDREGPAIQVVLRDITERKRMEEEVRRLASFPMVNPRPIVEIDMEGRVCFANPSAQRLFPDLQERGPEHPWLAGVVSLVGTRREEDESILSREVAVDGRWYHQAIHPMPDLQRIRIYAMDITERVHAEEALRQTQEDLNRAQAVAHTGSWRLDVRRNELLWSDETYRIFGIPKGTPMTYETFLAAVHPEDLDDVNRKWTAALRGEPYDVDHRIVVDGKAKWVRERAELEFDQDGMLRGGFGTVQDITERKAAEEALRQAKEELEKRVQERTADLEKVVGQLQAEVAQRGLAEQAAKTERQRLYGVLETLPVYVVLLTQDYHVPFANRFFRERFGESGGKRCFEYLFGRTEPCPICETYTVLKTKAPHHWEWTGPDGRDYDISDFPFTDIDGSPLILEMGIDVTERKRAEAGLRRASLYARSLIEASLDPLVAISPEGKITDVNKATEQVTGLGREKLVGSDFSTYFTEPGKARQGYQTVLARGFVRDYPLTIRDAQGHCTDVLYHATQYRDESGEVEGVFAAARDITERKAAERRQNVTHALLALFATKRTRKEYLDAVIEVLQAWSGCRHLGVRVVDQDRRIPYESHVGFTPEFLAMENWLSLKTDTCACIRIVLGTPEEPDRAVMTPGGSFCVNDGRAFLDRLTPAEQARYRGNCIRSGFNTIAVLPLRYHDRVLGAIHLADERTGMLPQESVESLESLAPLIGEAIYRFNAEEELERHRLHLEELVKSRTSALEQTAEDLRRSNKELEQFAYVASHDLQEPLRMVSGFMSRLQQRYAESLDDKAREYVVFAVEGARQMSQLVGDLLEYSRVQSRPRQLAPTDMKAVFEHAKTNCMVAIREANASVTCDDLPTLLGDQTQLVQLLQNLIGNAVKFRRPQVRPEIHVSARREGGDWVFCVRDNGIGLAMDQAQRIFLIFQRLHPRDKYPGTGIGLAICRKIVERHGGRIWVESTPGQGSAFSFALPAAGAPQVTESDSATLWEVNP